MLWIILGRHSRADLIWEPFTRRFDRQSGDVDGLNWSTNWIFIFSHKGIQVSEKRASQSGLVWLLPSSSSSSIPFWSPWDFFFHPTSQSLSPNLLCSTWKDSGYRSFSPPPPQIPSRSIRPLILTSSLCPLKRRDIFYSCLEGCIIPALPFSLRQTNGRWSGGSTKREARARRAGGGGGLPPW